MSFGVIGFSAMKRNHQLIANYKEEKKVHCKVQKVLKKMMEWIFILPHFTPMASIGALAIKHKQT